MPRRATPGVETCEHTFPWDTSRGAGLEVIDKIIRVHDLDREEVEITHTAIQLEFMNDGVHKGKTMTFHVSCPDRCDLKSKPDDMRLTAERCMKRWEILHV